MQLSKRLQTLAGFVPKGGKLVDVGTDHGYLPIYLRKNNHITSCIACDIHKGPLENAAKHIQKYQVTGIELRQGNGLQVLGVQDDIDTILIAGMGGYLINDILRKSSEVVKGSSVLILQPQTEYDLVRKTVHALGFSIENESFIEEDGKYYTVLYAIKGKECYEKPIEYLYGKKNLENPSEAFKQWMLKKEKTLHRLLEHLEKVENQPERKTEIKKEYLLHKEAMKCIE